MPAGVHVGPDLHVDPQPEMLHHSTWQNSGGRTHPLTASGVSTHCTPGGAGPCTSAHQRGECLYVSLAGQRAVQRSRAAHQMNDAERKDGVETLQNRTLTPKDTGRWLGDSLGCHSSGVPLASRGETRDAADQPAVSVLGSPHHKGLSAPNVNPTSPRNPDLEKCF